MKLDDLAYFYMIQKHGEPNSFLNYGNISSEYVEAKCKKELLENPRLRENIIVLHKQLATL